MAGLALLVVLVLVPALAVLGVVALVGLPPSAWLRAGAVVVGWRPLGGALRRPCRSRWGPADWRSSPGGCRSEWLGLPILESYLPAPDHDVERLSVRAAAVDGVGPCHLARPSLDGDQRLIRVDPCDGAGHPGVGGTDRLCWLRDRGRVPRISPSRAGNARGAGRGLDRLGVVVGATSAAGVRRLGPRHPRSSRRSRVGAAGPAPGPDACGDHRRQCGRDSPHRAGPARRGAGSIGGDGHGAGRRGRSPRYRPRGDPQAVGRGSSGVEHGTGRTARPRERRPPAGPRRPGPGRRHPRSGSGFRAACGGNRRPHRTPAGARRIGRLLCRVRAAGQCDQARRGPSGMDRHPVSRKGCWRSVSPTTVEEAPTPDAAPDCAASSADLPPSTECWR